MGRKGTPSFQPQRHPPPTPPALPSPTYRRTAGRQNPCLCPERCHVVAWEPPTLMICSVPVLYGSMLVALRADASKTLMSDDTKETAVW